jgi:hypothetical protein
MSLADAFVHKIAALPKEGEAATGTREKIWENDEAFDTLHELISEARAILGLPSA